MLPRLVLLQTLGQKEDQTFSSRPARFGMMPRPNQLSGPSATAPLAHAEPVVHS